MLSRFGRNDMGHIYSYLKYAIKRAPRQERKTKLKKIEEMVIEHDKSLGVFVSDEVSFK